MVKKIRILLISMLVFFAVGMFAGCTKTINGKVLTSDDNPKMWC